MLLFVLYDYKWVILVFELLLRTSLYQINNDFIGSCKPKQRFILSDKCNMIGLIIEEIKKRTNLTTARV